MPSSVLPIIASSEDSTIAATRASAASVCACPLTIAARSSVIIAIVPMHGLEQQQRLVRRVPDEGPQAVQRPPVREHREQDDARRRLARAEPERRHDERRDAEELEGIVPRPR